MNCYIKTGIKISIVNDSTTCYKSLRHQFGSRKYCDVRAGGCGRWYSVLKLLVKEVLTIIMSLAVVMRNYSHAHSVANNDLGHDNFHQILGGDSSLEKLAL